MKVNRETHQHVNTEDLKEFVNSLKPMEITTLVEVLLRDKHIVHHPELNKLRIQKRILSAIEDLLANSREIDNLLSGKGS